MIGSGLIETNPGFPSRASDVGLTRLTLSGNAREDGLSGCWSRFETVTIVCDQNRIERITKGLRLGLCPGQRPFFGSPGWTRTNNPPFNTSTFTNFRKRSGPPPDLGIHHSPVVTGFQWPSLNP